MSVYRFNRRGTLVIDRRYREIGRIRRASGTSDKDTFKAILVMLKQFHERGKHEVLREIQAGIVSPITVYGYWQSGQMDHLPSAATLQKVDPVILDWIDGRTDVVATTRRNYKQVIERFVKYMGNGRIHDLPNALKKYRKEMTDKARTFKYTRTAIQAFLANTFGRSSVLWQQVSEIKPLEYDEEQAPELEVADAYDLIQKLPKPHADIVRAMVFSGMHWIELTDKWEIKADRIWILGAKKRKGKRRTREVPLIQNIVRPTRSEKAFRVALNNIRPDLQIYSFRRTYTHWLVESKITRIRRRMYLGHGPSDTSDRYEKHELTEYLKKDAEQIRNYIENKLIDRTMPDTIKEIFGDSLIEQETKATPSQLL